MTITINGTTGIAGVDGSAGTPAVQGADDNTGIFYPAVDTVGISTGGSERMRVDSSGNVGIGVTPAAVLDVKNSIRVSGLTTEDCNLEIGAGRSGSGYTYIDLIGDTTYTDFGFRILRNNAGANAKTDFQHRGTGNLTIKAVEAANILLYTSNTERLRIDASGNVLVTSTAVFGYGTGSGGTVTQATNKGTGVTLNKPTGKITMSNAALAGGATVHFNCFNTFCTTNSIVIASLDGSSTVNSTRYEVLVTNANTGIIGFAVKNVTGTSYSEALIINFAIMNIASV